MSTATCTVCVKRGLHTASVVRVCQALAHGSAAVSVDLSVMDTRMPAGDDGVASPALRGSTLSYTASATSGEAPGTHSTPKDQESGAITP